MVSQAESRGRMSGNEARMRDRGQIDASRARATAETYLPSMIPLPAAEACDMFLLVDVPGNKAESKGGILQKGLNTEGSSLNRDWSENVLLTSELQRLAQNQDEMKLLEEDVADLAAEVNRY